jgi:hypothetical protein
MAGVAACTVVPLVMRHGKSCEHYQANGHRQADGHR